MVTPIDMVPLLAIEPVVMGEMKPVLELLKQLVHNSQADRAEIARQHRQISDLRNAVCRLQAIHATPKTATTVDMSPDSVSRLDLSPSLPIQSFADLDDLRQDLASVAPDPNPAPSTTSKLSLPRVKAPPPTVMLSAQRLPLNSELGKSEVRSGERTWASWNQGTAPAASVQNSASKMAKTQSRSEKKGDKEKPFKKTKA